MSPRLHNVCSHPDAAAGSHVGLAVPPSLNDLALKNLQFRRSGERSQAGNDRQLQAEPPSVHGGGGAATETFFRVRVELSLYLLSPSGMLGEKSSWENTYQRKYVPESSIITKRIQVP